MSPPQILGLSWHLAHTIRPPQVLNYREMLEKVAGAAVLTKTAPES